MPRNSITSLSKWLGIAGVCGSVLVCPGFAAETGVVIQGIGKPKPAARAKNSPANTKSTDRPAWVEVEKTVQAQLAAKSKDYKAGDLITREDATAVLAKLKTAGWEISNPTEFMEPLLPATDELVRSFQSKNGKNFMRHIASVPGGYDRVDKLRNLPNGKRRLQELISQPGGYTLIQYMATTPGGKTMGRELSSKSRGNFNASTQKIYTEAQLLAALKTIYDSEQNKPPSTK